MSSLAGKRGDLADHTLAVYERDADIYFHDRFLYPPEREFLRRLRSRWASTAMLDIGVGGGRTAYTFGALAGHYLGIDYSPRMIERARQTIGEDDHCQFRLADVRDLSAVDQLFDVALFSLNGLDTLSHLDRLQALQQMRNVIAPNGLLLFSSHSVHALRHNFLPVRFTCRSWTPHGAYLLTRATVRSLTAAALKRRLDLESVERTGWTRLRDGSHHFALELYYVSVPEQRRQLDQTGWRLLDVWDLDGKAIDPARPGHDWWLHYLCQPV